MPTSPSPARVAAHFLQAASAAPISEMTDDALSAWQHEINRVLSDSLTKMKEHAAFMVKTFADVREAGVALQAIDKLELRMRGMLQAAQAESSARAKGQTPKAFMTLSRAVTKAIQERLDDPGAIEVTLALLGGYSPLRSRPALTIKMRNKIDWQDYGGSYNTTLTIVSGPAGEPLDQSGKPVPGNARAIAESFVKLLGNWPGLKGKADENASRASVASRVKDILNRTYRGGDETTVSKDNRTVSTSYRTNLPKEGDRGIDEYKYRQMRDTELSRLDKDVRLLLGPLSAAVADVQLQLEEKGWVSITVKLK